MTRPLDDDVQMACEELRDLTTCRCLDDYKVRGLMDPTCNCAFRVHVDTLTAALQQAEARVVAAEVWAENTFTMRQVIQGLALYFRQSDGAHDHVMATERALAALKQIIQRRAVIDAAQEANREGS